MNIHQLIDSFTVSAASLIAGSDKFFAASIESGTFTEYLAEISLDIPNIVGEGEYEIEVDTPVGQLKPAFLIDQWKGSKYPTIIYHHGNSEQPFNFSKLAKNSFRDIFIKHKPISANLIVLRAPFHNNSLKEYKKKIAHLSNFTAMLCTSVILADELIRVIGKKSEGQIAVSGISLGGWVTNLHKTYYDTADVYIPLLAGAALGELFLTSKYRKMTGEIAAEKPDLLRKLLNFEADFKETDHDNIYPLLGKHDQYIEYGRQKKSYKRPVDTLEKGHVTALLAANDLYDHIIKHLTNVKK